MERKTVRKRWVALLTALIFIIVPIMKPYKQAKAADGSAVAAQAGTVEEPTTEWLVMSERLDRAIQNGIGQNVNFIVGNHFQIPTDILRKLVGKHATLALHTNNDVAFSISGGEIYQANTGFIVDVSFEAVIPDGVKAQIPGSYIRKEFSMERKEAYPCCLNVHLALGKENAGRHAVLYVYDETGGAMRQEGIFRINGQGQAMFPLKRGDEYVVSVYGGYTVKPGDTLSHIAARSSVSVQALMKVNPQIRDADLIQPGQMINLPD